MSGHRSFLLLALLLLLLPGCQRTVEPILPLPQLSIGVATFSQPTHTTQLLAGHIPHPQGLISPEEEAGLDIQFRAKLSATGRTYSFLPATDWLDTLVADDRGRRSALATWLEHGRQAGVDLLIVPQIIDWQPRVGGPAGAQEPAAVMADFYLIDTRGEGVLLQRSRYAVQQEALINNILTLGDFIQRKGRWVTAEVLAGEAMDKAIKEFGL